jgi:hypothetical protein
MSLITQIRELEDMARTKQAARMGLGPRQQHREVALAVSFPYVRPAAAPGSIVMRSPAFALTFEYDTGSRVLRPSTVTTRMSVTTLSVDGNMESHGTLTYRYAMETPLQLWAPLQERAGSVVPIRLNLDTHDVQVRITGDHGPATVRMTADDAEEWGVDLTHVVVEGLYVISRIYNDRSEAWACEPLTVGFFTDPANVDVIARFFDAADSS